MQSTCYKVSKRFEKYMDAVIERDKGLKKRQQETKTSRFFSCLCTWFLCISMLCLLIVAPILAVVILGVMMIVTLVVTLVLALPAACIMSHEYDISKWQVFGEFISFLTEGVVGWIKSQAMKDMRKGARALWHRLSFAYYTKEPSND